MLKKSRENYFILLIFCTLSLVNNELIFVYEHVRHGARGPSSEYRSLFNNKTFYDEYNIHWDGDGELTMKGKFQHYILGIKNRLKYSTLLNYDKYNENELLIHTTNSNRVRESAFFQLLAMYKPIIKTNLDNANNDLPFSERYKFYYPPNYKRWIDNENILSKKIINEAELTINNIKNKKNLNENPFSIKKQFNFTEKNKKYKLNAKIEEFKKNRTFFKRACLNHEKYINYHHRKNYQNIIKGIIEREYGKQLQEYFKYENKDWLYGIHRSFSIIDHYIVNIEEDRDISNFLEFTGIDKDDFYKSCKQVYEWWLYHIFCDKKSCVMESSTLMEDLIQYMDLKVNNKTNELKMVMDFGHDVTVAPMQLFMHETFGVDYTTCGFACNIYFELHYEKDGKYFVEYFVDDDLRLKMTYNKFRENVVEKIWSQEEKDEFCKGNIIKVLHPVFLLCVYIILIILFGLIGVLVIYKYYQVYVVKRRNKDNVEKNIINNSNNQEKKDGKEMELIEN